MTEIIEYLVESRWVGFGGGYGSENAIARELNKRAGEGWKITRTEASYQRWMLFLPRVKLLIIWERPKATGGMARVAVTAHGGEREPPPATADLL